VPTHEWRQLSDIEKIKHILGMSLDDVLEIMSIPVAEADLHERNFKLQVFQTMMKAGLQFARDQRRDEENERALEHLAAALRPRDDS